MRSPSEVEPPPPARVLVSVLAYNSPATTAETLRSLRRQTHANFRLLLVDNASECCSFEETARSGHKGPPATAGGSDPVAPV